MNRYRIAVCAAAATVLIASGLSSRAGGVGFGAPVTVSGSGGEPNILISGNAIYASNVHGQVWRSTDGGGTWAHRTDFSAPICCGDFDLERDAAGNLYGVGLGELVYSGVRRSTDGAGSWESVSYTAPEEDRPWLAAGAPDEVFLSYHDMATQLIYVEHSTDGGNTWTWSVPLPAPTAGGVADEADAAAFTYGDSLNGNIVRAADGTAYVAWVASNPAQSAAHPPYAGPLDRVFVSVVRPGPAGDPPVVESHAVYQPDARSLAVPLVQDAPSIAGFPSTTVDAAGNVYVVWCEAMDGLRYDTYYSYSSDHGASWSSPQRVHSGGTDIFPAAAAGAAGVLDVAWYGANAVVDPSAAAKSVDWRVQFAQIRNAQSPATRTTEIVDASPVMHHGDVCQTGLFCGITNGGDRSLLDFFEIALDAAGNANIVYADNGRCTNGCSPNLMFVKQAGGPTAA